MTNRNRQLTNSRLAALGLALALQGAAIWLILHSLEEPRPALQTAEHETEIVLLPTLPPPLAKTKRPRRESSGSNAITPFFNPYTFHSETLAAPSRQGLAFALSACNVGNYDMATDDVRAACDRIGAFIKRDPGHFGLTSEVANSGHWARELARREAPHLLPCMSPGGVMIDLFCVANFIVHPYDQEKHARYSE